MSQNNSTLNTQHSTLACLACDLYRFIRFSAFGATAVLPLLGAAASGGPVGWAETGGLLVVALCFHCYAYVSNDLVDRAVDARQPMRQRYPLVRGAIRPWQALAFALAMLLAAFVASAGRPLTWLAAAFALMTVYNLWGKRCPLPPLTDAVQGLGWAALLVWGAGGALTPLVLALAAHEFALIMLVNGLHGGLRDLASDRAGGARTTALLLGARPTPAGGVQISPALLAYGLCWQACAMAALLLPLAFNWVGYAAWGWFQTAAALGCLLLLLIWAARAGRATNGQGGMIALGMLHLIVSLSAPIVLVAGRMSGPLLISTLVAHSVPLLANGMTYAMVRWAVRHR